MEVKRSNYVKRSARIIRRGSSYDNTPFVLANIDSTESIIQYILPLSSKTLKGSFIHMGVKIGKFPDLKKQTVALEIENRWCKDIIKEGARKIAYMRGGPNMDQGYF